MVPVSRPTKWTVIQRGNSRILSATLKRIYPCIFPRIFLRLKAQSLLFCLCGTRKHVTNVFHRCSALHRDGVLAAACVGNLTHEQSVASQDRSRNAVRCAFEIPNGVGFSGGALIFGDQDLERREWESNPQRCSADLTGFIRPLPGPSRTLSKKIRGPGRV